jgi:hypothetical protein
LSWLLPCGLCFQEPVTRTVPNYSSSHEKSSKQRIELGARIEWPWNICDLPLE